MKTMIQILTGKGRVMKAQGKRFLTDRGDEGGSIRWYVTASGDDDYYAVESELYLSDCSKVICLEFSCNKQSQLPKRLAKIDELIEELMGMRHALAKANQPSTKTRPY